MKCIDLVGKTFGRWRVVSKASRTYQTMWDCVCRCGSTKTVSGSNLRSGKSTSCGCHREELRPTYAKRRNYSGLNNPRAKASSIVNKGVWVPSSSIWYRRAASIFYSAKRHNIKVGFKNVAEFASYIKDIAPDECPVFGVKFTERGRGFSKWSPSIDKIDPKKGYVRGNIQIISVLANCMKRDASSDQLMSFAKWVLKCHS